MLLWGRVMLLWAGGHAFMSFYGLGGSCFNGWKLCFYGLKGNAFMGWGVMLLWAGDRGHAFMGWGKVMLLHSYCKVKCSMFLMQ